MHNSGASRGGIAKLYLIVVASEAKQSIDTLGFGSRLKLLDPGVATLIEVPNARTSS